MSHTPGPWRVRYSQQPNTPHFAIEVELPCINGLSAWFTLAHVFIPDEAEVGYTDGALSEKTAAANATIMAEAPELLEALREVHRLLTNDDVRPNNFVWAAQKAEAVLARVDAALQEKIS